MDVVSSLVLQTLDRTTFGRMSFPGARWYAVIVRDPQTVRDQRKFGNHCFTGIFNRLSLKQCLLVAQTHS